MINPHVTRALAEARIADLHRDAPRRRPPADAAPDPGERSRATHPRP